MVRNVPHWIIWELFGPQRPCLGGLFPPSGKFPSHSGMATTGTLLNGTFQSRTHKVRWDGTDSAGDKVGRGAYFYRLMSVDGDDGLGRRGWCWCDKAGRGKEEAVVYSVHYGFFVSKHTEGQTSGGRGLGCFQVEG